MRPPGLHRARRLRPTRARTPAGRPSAAVAWTRPGTERRRFTVKYDATAPAVSVGLSRAPDSERLVQRRGLARRLGRLGCDVRDRLPAPRRPTAAPTPAASPSARAAATTPATSAAAAAPRFSYDATPPSVSAAADRARGRRGLVQARALGHLRRHGRDLGDRVLHRARPLRRPRPDERLVAGTCRDHAGNTGRGARTRSATTRPRRWCKVGGEDRQGRGEADLAALGRHRLGRRHPHPRPERRRPFDASSISRLGTSFADRSVRNGTRYR